MTRIVVPEQSEEIAIAPSPEGAESRLLRWLKMLVGEENRECAMAIFEATLMLTNDIIQITAAVNVSGRSAAVQPLQKLFRNIITIAVMLPPRCFEDEHLANIFGKMYEILELSRQPDLTGGRPSGLVDLIDSMPGLELLEKFPGLSDQLADTLVIASDNSDIDTQVNILVALLPDAALQKIDDALNTKATDLPGAGFINTLNQYDNDLGIDIIPDAVVDAPAIDLLIRTVGVTGVLDKDDTGFLLTLTGIMRKKVKAGIGRNPMDRIKEFVMALLPSGASSTAPADLPRKPVRIEIVPRGEEIQTPSPTGRIKIDEGVMRRMQTLAGI